VPRRSASGARPERDALYETAAPQSGYLTLAQAAAAGYSSPLVEYHVRTGRLERVGRGIFRLVHFPPADNEDLVVFWLWSKREGVFSHETALALHQLSDALPGKVHVTVPLSWRRRRLRVPGGLVLHMADLSKAERGWHGPVPLTTVLRSVVDVLTEGDPALGEQAVAQGIKRRLFSRQDLRAALAERSRRKPAET
jgi:predicted transcriptional regulator of viral defense system